MLTIIIPGTELYDEVKGEFILAIDDVTLELEHSLVSLSKWESKFRKPFLAPGDKTSEEILGYVEAMILTPDFSPDVLTRISKENFDDINNHIASEQSATTFMETPAQRARGRGEIITSELIYFWMVTYQIPFECETWHLNRLFNLLRICNIKNSKQRKMSRSEIAARNRDLNAQRRAQLGTSG